MMEAQQRILDKWDPSGKSLAVKGFGSETSEERAAVIQKFLKEHITDPGHFKITNPMSGPYSNKTMKPLSIVEFESIEKRDGILKVLEDKSPPLKSGPNTLNIEKAKPLKQVHRNGILKRAKHFFVYKAQRRSISYNINSHADKNTIPRHRCPLGIGRALHSSNTAGIFRLFPGSLHLEEVSCRHGPFRKLIDS